MNKIECVKKEETKSKHNLSLKERKKELELDDQ